MTEGFPSVSIHIPELKSGEEAAWTEVCGRFQIGLASKARQLVRNSAVARKHLYADDLVQETFLKAWRSRKSFRGETTAQLAKWMLTVLKNTFLDDCRKMNIEQNRETWQDVCGETETPSAIVSFDEQEAEMLAALDGLTEDQQRVIAMRIFEGLTFPQIADRMNTNVNTIGSIYRRGLIRITLILKKASRSEHFNGDID